MPSRCRLRPESSNFFDKCGILFGVSDDARADVELVHAARAGDVAALGTLLERHRAALYATALMVLGDPTEANDAVQDTLLTAVARLD